MNRHEPFTGFGDDTNTSVKFSLRAEGGVAPDWDEVPVINQFQIVNASSTVTQHNGWRPMVLEAELLFDPGTDIDLFKSLQGVRATLRYLYGVTSDSGGTATTILGSTYLVLPDTLLLRVKDIRRYRRAGVAICTATFQRTVSESAYYGFSLYAEDE